MSHNEQGPAGPNDTWTPPPAAEPGQPGAAGQPVTLGQPAAPVQSAAYAQPAGYGQPTAQGAPYAPAPGRTTDGVSIAALITGIVGLGLVPIVLGILGLRRTRANGTSGRGLSIAGIVLGTLSLIAGIIIIGGLVLAVVNSDRIVSEALAAVTDAPVAEQSVAADQGAAEDSLTPLLDVVPLELAGFSTQGFAPDPALLGAGALEAYTATYADGTSEVAVVVTAWTSEDEARAWAASTETGFTAEQLIDSDDTDGVAYRVYEVDGVTTVVSSNVDAAVTLTGPYDAVAALFTEFPV